MKKKKIYIHMSFDNHDTRVYVCDKEQICKFKT